MSTSSSPAAVVHAYFERMLARDPGVADLFHEDAALVGLGGVKQGRPAIRAFYEGAIAGAGPTPSLVGDLLVSGSRVAAEIHIALTGAPPVHVIDLFVVEGGLIRSLTYFVADH